MGSTVLTRRQWFAGMAAVLVPLVIGRRASAAPYESVPGYGSKDEFKRDCTAWPGATFDVGQYSTACNYPDGDIKVCDENGKNCTFHEAELVGGIRPGWLDNVLAGTSPLPIFAEQPAADDIAPTAKAHGKGKKGRKRRKR